jgi:1,4-alpha-glucan branching enzyme
MESASPFLSSPRYSARIMRKPVNFICKAPGAKRVCLVGEFNNWDPEAHPMERQSDGAWLVQVALHHGHHQYRFLVDGTPELDPRSTGTAKDSAGKRVSLIAVS